MTEDTATPLQRHFGLLQATALNVTMVVGAGVFITIPLMVKELPGPYALLGWLVAGALMLVDGMVWSELGATLPGSGGSYLYLLECYGAKKWGRLMAFLFIWQFLISGPLETASGLIAIATFSNSLSPAFAAFNQDWTWEWRLWETRPVAIAISDYTWKLGEWKELSISVSPARMLAFSIGILILILLYRRVTILSKLTVTFWLGVLAVIGWILVEGALHFDADRVFDFSGNAANRPENIGAGLGAAMILAMYSYLGYYNVCYIGDEVKNPGRTIPRAILLSSVIVLVLFIALHIAMLSVVSWRDLPMQSPEIDSFSLPAEFMRRLHGPWAATLVTCFLIWSCFGSVFAALLGYSRIPYGAAKFGHFFSMFARVHPRHLIPHVSLLLVGGLTLFWSFFSLQSVIDAMITTRIVEQFLGQCIGVMLLRRAQPNRPRPYRIWLYPLPCLLAMIGWLYMYFSAPVLFIILGAVTLLLGAAVYAVWKPRIVHAPDAV